MIADPNGAAEAWCQRHGALPINHLAVVKESLMQSNPSAIKEIYRVLRESKQAAPASSTRDTLQFGVENVRRSLDLIYRLLSAAKADSTTVCSGRVV